MADIEKSLRPKYRPTKEDLQRLLPEQYRQYADVFDPYKADELPPHRPGIDYYIPLKTDEDGKEKKYRGARCTT